MQPADNGCRRVVSFDEASDRGSRFAVMAHRMNIDCRPRSFSIKKVERDASPDRRLVRNATS